MEFDLELTEIKNLKTLTDKPDQLEEKNVAMAINFIIDSMYDQVLNKIHEGKICLEESSLMIGKNTFTFYTYKGVFNFVSLTSLGMNKQMKYHFIKKLENPAYLSIKGNLYLDARQVYDLKLITDGEENLDSEYLDKLFNLDDIIYSEVNKDKVSQFEDLE